MFPTLYCASARGSSTFLLVFTQITICAFISSILYSIFGSKHRIKRSQIKVDSIEEISEDEVEDPVVKAIL